MIEGLRAFLSAQLYSVFERPPIRFLTGIPAGNVIKGQYSLHKLHISPLFISMCDA